MGSVDVEPLYSYHPESASDYFADPYAFWRAIPFGTEGPSEFFTRSLGTTLRFDNVPEEAQSEILRKHPFKWGMDYYSNALPNTDLLSICVKNIPAHWSTVLKIPGLEVDPKDPNVWYVWQEGLTEVLGYYFYNTTNRQLTSIADIARRVTGKKVKFYFYGEEYEKASQRFLKLLKPPDDYYAFILANPRSLRNIVGSAHELGHAACDEHNPDRFEQILQQTDYEEQAAPFDSRLEAINATVMTDEDRNKAVDEYNKDYEASPAYRTLMGVEMILEYETWKETLPIMEAAGLLPVFENHEEELLNYIFWAIKTRMAPPDSNGPVVAPMPE